MPQADPALAAEWPDGDREAVGYLIERGWRLDRRYRWTPPTPEYVADERESSAIKYLRDMWDFG